jgi:osmotically-inducible protein OsmY
MTKDSDLQRAVQAELGWDPGITAAHIGVTAADGVITLSGHVDSFAQKHAAEAAAHRVKGVNAVAEALEVRLPFEHRKGDDDIAAAASNRLAWDVTVPTKAVVVTVENGFVRLTGEVGWHYQKEAAEHDVRHLVGVVGVANNITIKPPHVNTAKISDDITHALHRSWFADPETVFVDADGGNIRLTGTVRSWHDRQAAAEAAWAAPGASSVENDLVVLTL